MVKHANNKGTGSSDVNTIWDIAHYQWVKYVLIMLVNTVYNENDGKRDPNLSGDISGTNNPRDCFNIYKIEKLEDS